VELSASWMRACLPLTPHAQAYASYIIEEARWLNLTVHAFKRIAFKALATLLLTCILLHFVRSVLSAVGLPRAHA
jgi:hypothetical protein